MVSPLRLFTASPRVPPPVCAAPFGGQRRGVGRLRAGLDGETILLRGAGATRRNLAEQMRRHPAVVHFATHVLESAERRLAADRSQPDGPAGGELLTPFEIAHWRTGAGLIVLSGCYSAQGALCLEPG